MALREQLDSDLKTSMLAKDSAKTSALRLIKAAVRNKEIDTKSTLDDAAMTQVLTSLKKQREDAIAQYQQGGREDLVAKESAELAIIQAYLPAGLSESELTAIIAKAVADAQAQGPKDMGKVMKLVTPQTTGRADGKIVSEKVKAELQKMQS